MLGRRNTAVDLPSAVVCQRCKRFEVDLTTASDNPSATDTELKASRQVISLLQRQLELFQVEKEGLEKLIVSQSDDPAPSCDEDTFKNIDNCSPDEIQRKLLTLIKTQLYAKDEEIVKLKSSLKEAQNEREQANIQMHMLEDDVLRLKNENSLLKENLALRDQTITSLSAEVFEQSRLKPNDFLQRRQSSTELAHNNSSSHQKQLSNLGDTLDAYKNSNKMLGTTITRLNEKCSQAERKEMEARSQCQELEAKCCQIQSKLLSLLKEIEQSSKQANIQHDQVEVIQSESVKLLIKRLLEDKSLDIPLSWKEGNKSSRANRLDKSTECDELGFYIVKSNYDQSPKKSRSRGLRRGLSEAAGNFPSTVGEESNDLIQQRTTSVDAIKDDELAWRLRWDEFIVEFDNIELSTSKEFKALLRTGVPQEYRCKIWKALIDLKIGKEREKLGPDYYQSLLEPRSHQAIQNPSTKQIELDLLRTLPNNRYFETMDSSGTVRLRRVLSAFSGHKPQVGYCQGMNRLAAVALLVLPEEEAFWCLVAIVDKIMPIGYYNDLWLAQVDTNVVLDFVTIKMPHLSYHFKRQGIELSLFAWFLTIFVDGTPPTLFLRLWDCFLFEGDKIMFRVALALLKRHEDELIKINNSVAVNNFIRSTVNELTDIDEFFKIAFQTINPLPGRILRYKREQHFSAMKSSLKCFGHIGTASVKDIVDQSKPDKFNDNNADRDSLHEDSSIISI